MRNAIIAPSRHGACDGNSVVADEYPTAKIFFLIEVDY